MSKYWEQEKPRTVNTNKNVLQFYEKAGKLSVARLPWTDKDGTEQQGKTVCFDIAALLESDTEAIKETRSILAKIVSGIDLELELRKEG